VLYALWQEKNRRKRIKRGEYCQKMKKGRRFEYQVVEYLRRNGIEVVRNSLSRKPDLILSSPYLSFLEVKKRLREGKEKGFVITNPIEFLRNGKKEGYVDYFYFEDYFPTITQKGSRGYIIVIPERIDEGYLAVFEKEIAFKYQALQNWKELIGGNNNVLSF